MARRSATPICAASCGSATSSSPVAHRRVPSEHTHGRKWDKLRRTRAYQPVLTDIRTIAPTGWYGNPEHATVDKGKRMLQGIADAIAQEATEIFRQLDEVQGGTAEIKHLRMASS
jgi:creatinine amidohydrolase